jgi:hypothetical protein
MNGINIPSGVNVRCDAFIKTLKPGAVVYQMYIDGKECMTYNPSGPRTSFSSARSAALLAATITVSGDTHTFALVISSGYHVGPIFDLDDVVITASSGPNGDPVCTWRPGDVIWEDLTVCLIFEEFR